MRRIIVGVSGASGMPWARCLLQSLHGTEGIEVHVIISAGARAVLNTECPRPEGDGTAPLDELTQFAHVVHDPAHIGAGPASGSWRHSGMVICPCSMATLACVATGAGTNLLHRAADVCLKERRPLIVVARETPLSAIHLQNMLTLSQAGACIMPPCPAFYGQARNISDIVEHFTGRVLDQLGIEHDLGHRWQGDSREL